MVHNLTFPAPDFQGIVGSQNEKKKLKYKKAIK